MFWRILGIVVGALILWFGLKVVVSFFKNRKAILSRFRKQREEHERKKSKIPAYYYVCPFDSTYSGEMQFLGKVYSLVNILHDEIDALKGQPIIGERLQCPRCMRVFGWHQLKKIKTTQISGKIEVKDLPISIVKELRIAGKQGAKAGRILRKIVKAKMEEE